ncbi:MAG TPA: ferrochelatase [Mycobacteriales bacterium]|nr:ferrochelatase [Mycobacteriales bacterium]
MTVDALLVLSFGGPEGPADVMPFLERVTAGRGVPAERLAEVAEHYYHFGGVSPINAANRSLVDAVRAELTARGLDLPVYWGNRNWHPFVADTVATMTADGVRRALVFVTSAYSSYSSCRQYQEDLAAARAQVGEPAPELLRLRQYFDHPGFIEPQRDAVREAVAAIAAERRASTRMVFTAHSIPQVMAARSGPGGGAYVQQLEVAAGLVATAAPELQWRLAYQSRSGSPSVPWLEPAIVDHLGELAAEGVTDVVVVPVGFVSDHLEVRWDLDVEAAAAAEQLGFRMRRTPTPGPDPRFAAMVRELVEERLDPTRARRALSTLGPAHDVCPLDCCPAPSRPGR